MLFISIYSNTVVSSMYKCSTDYQNTTLKKKKAKKTVFKQYEKHDLRIIDDKES